MARWCSSRVLDLQSAGHGFDRLDYCNVVFAGLPACDIQRLQSVLNAAVRLVGRRLIATRSCDFSATRPPLAASETARWVQAVYDGTSLLVRRRTILPGEYCVTRAASIWWATASLVARRINCTLQLHALLSLFTANTFFFFLLLADLITPSAAATVRPGLRSTASNTVAVPRTTSSLGDRSFAAAGPRAWNKLPPPLRRVYSAATFKRQLKIFLYNHAFNSHC